MKKSYIVIRFLVVLMLIAAFAGLRPHRNRQARGKFVDDSVITTKVKTLLAADEFLESFQISVETRKGVVQMSGFVDTQNA